MKKGSISIITILLIILIILVIAFGSYFVIKDSATSNLTNNNVEQAVNSSNENSQLNDEVISSEKQEIEEDVNKHENDDAKEEIKEDVKEVSLDSKVAKLIDCMTDWFLMERVDGKWKIDGNFPKDSFYGFDSDKIDVTYFSDAQIHSIAFEYYFNLNGMNKGYEIPNVESSWDNQTAEYHMNKENMNRIIVNVFGKNIKYLPVTFKHAINATVKYSQENSEYIYTGVGGGIPPYIAQQ